jgi:tetratricopeptide (TPR) repeat protein
MKIRSCMGLAIWTFVLIPLLGFNAVDLSNAGDIGGVPLGGQCAICGKWVPAGQSHSCWQRPKRPSGGNYPPTSRRPSSQELEQERADMVDHWNEKGLDAYDRGNYAAAIRCFQMALEYDPHNPALIDNLKASQKKAREAEAQELRRAKEATLQRAALEEARRKALAEAAAASAHSKAAAAKGLEEASRNGQKVFDTRGERVKVPTSSSTGVLDAQGVGRPIEISAALAKHPEIRKLQKERSGLVDELKRLEEELASIRDKKVLGEGKKGDLDVKEARAKQGISNVTNKIGYVDVKIESFVINLPGDKVPSKKP